MAEQDSKIPDSSTATDEKDRGPGATDSSSSPVPGPRTPGYVEFEMRISTVLYQRLRSAMGLRMMAGELGLPDLFLARLIGLIEDGKHEYVFDLKKDPT